jgi:two-component system, OmpR family, sensor histidine kinase CiaH
MTRSKPFAVRATGSRADPFRTARLRLTLVYLAIITAIVAILSASLYEFHSHDVGRISRGRIVRAIPRERARELDAPGLGEYLERLGRSILLADLLTILAGGGLSYILAARTLRPVKEAVEAEQRFFANAAHDLRTPLAVMRSEAEVALRSGHVEGAEAGRILASSVEEIDRMSAMVEQMLDLARSGSTASRAGAGPVALDLAALAGSVAARMSTQAFARGLRLEVDTPQAAVVRGDPRTLERAVSNILENAIAYTPSGGTVTVRAAAHGGHAELCITDTGIGISAEDLPRIVEPFFRGDRARGANIGGAGLGLTIAQNAVKENRGTMRAESRPGAGTTILLRFPLA